MNVAIDTTSAKAQGLTPGFAALLMVRAMGMVTPIDAHKAGVGQKKLIAKRLC
jgi:hypothetical protein